MTDEVNALPSEPNQHPIQPPRKKSWLMIFLVIILLGVIGAITYQYCNLYKRHSQLINQFSRLDKEVNQTQLEIQTLTQSLGEIKKSQTQVVDQLNHNQNPTDPEATVNKTLLNDQYTQLVHLDAMLNHLPLKTLTTPTVIPNNPPDNPNLSVWQKIKEQTLHSLNKIVIVKKYSASQAPLIMPEEKTFLLQNLHSQIATAKWALLHRNALIYQSSLQELKKWMSEYFLTNDVTTQNALKLLDNILTFNPEVSSQPNQKETTESAS